jgi:sterol desaturase/sphingolipid hydroxylase (fatty acid hydroxylase superfamily)
MGRVAAVLRGLAAGAVGWTAAEYGVHRWVMHGRHTTNPVTAEHLDHHRHLERTYPLAFDRFLWWPAAGGLLVGVPTAVLRSVPTGIGAGAGFAASYCAYRQVHWLIHHRAPRTRVGRWLRRHHFRHHAGSPRGNHGVTTPLWDVVLRTRRPDAGPVELSRGMAPPWLLDEQGRVRPELERDLTLRPGTRQGP